ncbi:flagellar hook capping FlgD N-terminal domain-containing protein [Roseicyclus persicicus]|uniref:Basal-body rod modification protein FlgD n=1 Tax=Roseicyclus persicicus TaxID=2650661 RepID=A0A7X6GZ06_9RHOB|nr:flagellar hook capping FlgD N-terminal domain-containing protein [Roseibacterium persicicum]NKX45005.1 flagellar hook assembly protein FlgD [Roseibacterium persicicum]
MEIFANSPASAARFGATSARPSAISADFETFLRLLTTQMQNQDPLNPMESTEFATQLAQFSGVEQQVRTNDLLLGLQAGLATLGMGQIGNWIGMEARAEMPVNFDGQTTSLSGIPHPLADRMELVVRDESGEIVQRIPMPLSDARFDWDGTGVDGTTVPPGLYSFAVQNWSDETLLEERGAMVYGMVEEAALVGGEVWLALEGGVSIPASDVLGLRAP